MTRLVWGWVAGLGFVSGIAQGNAGRATVVCLGLTSTLRGESSEEWVKITELTRLGGVQPLPSKSQRLKGFKGHIGTIPRLLRETDSDQPPSEIYNFVPT